MGEGTVQSKVTRKKGSEGEMLFLKGYIKQVRF